MLTKRETLLASDKAAGPVLLGGYAFPASDVVCPCRWRINRVLQAPRKGYGHAGHVASATLASPAPCPRLL